MPIVGDAKNVLGQLVAELRKTEWPSRETDAWWASFDDWRNQFPLHYHDPADGTLMPQFVVQAIDRVTKSDAVIATEVGQNQMWACQYYTYTDPRQWVSSGGLGTMGFGLPAGIGAQVGRPDATVIDIAGDGSIQMNMQEMATAVINDVPVVVCILNNGYLGMVRQWQELFWDKRYSFTCIEVRRTSSSSPRRTARSACASPSRTRSTTRCAPPSRRQAGRDRLPRLARGERLPDGARRRLDRRDARRHGAAEEEEAMKHTLSVLVENKPGVLTRVAACSRGAASTSTRSPSARPRTRRCRA